jgi:hypothetical protein
VQTVVGQAGLPRDAGCHHGAVTAAQRPLPVTSSKVKKVLSAFYICTWIGGFFELQKLAVGKLEKCESVSKKKFKRG